MASAAQPPEFKQVMRAYLKQAETQLVSLDATQNGQRAALLDEIISRNRLYVLAAQRSQAPELARVLRAFEPVLNTLADPEATPAQITLAQQQLVFEMGAMLTKLSPVASKAVHPTTHNL